MLVAAQKLTPGGGGLSSFGSDGLLLLWEAGGLLVRVVGCGLQAFHAVGNRSSWLIPRKVLKYTMYRKAVLIPHVACLMAALTPKP